MHERIVALNKNQERKSIFIKLVLLNFDCFRESIFLSVSSVILNSFLCDVISQRNSLMNNICHILNIYCTAPLDITGNGTI